MCIMHLTHLKSIKAAVFKLNLIMLERVLLWDFFLTLIDLNLAPSLIDPRRYIEL